MAVDVLTSAGVGAPVTAAAMRRANRADLARLRALLER